MTLLRKLFSYLQRELILQILTAILLLFIIWFRFIYKRLPRDIPFNLSFFGLLILIIICIFYVYNIYILFKSPLPKTWTTLLYPMTQKLVKPLLQLNQSILSKTQIRQILKILLKLLYKFFKIQILNKNTLYIHAFLTIIPQLIFVIFLVADCFFFKKLFLIYASIIIITYPLLMQYLIHVSEIIRKYDTEFLDEYFIIEITSEDVVYKESDFTIEGFLKTGKPTYFMNPSEIIYDSFNDTNEYKYLKTLKFIDYQTIAIYCNDLLYEYKILSQDERKDVILLKKQKVPTFLNKKTCNELLQFHINIHLLKKNFIFDKIHSKKSYVKIEILIKIIGLICWSYILVVSIHTLHFTDLELTILKNLQENMEPFSGLLMDE